MPAKRDEMMDMEEEEVIDLSNPEVVQKYKAAAEVAHRLLFLFFSLFCDDVTIMFLNICLVDFFKQARWRR